MANKIEKTGEKISREAGIDFKKYRNPELTEKIGDLVGFTGRIHWVLLRYNGFLLVVLIALCAWFYTRQAMNIPGIVLFFLFGFLVCVLAGTALGTMRLAEIAAEDSTGVIVLLLQLVKDVRLDLSRLSQKEGKGATPAADLTRGLSYLVIIPTVKKIVKNKLSILSGPVNFILGNTLYYFTGSLAAALDKEEPGEAGAGTDPGELKAFEKSIDDAGNKISSLGEETAGKLKIPARILLILSLLLGLPILALIYLVF